MAYHVLLYYYTVVVAYPLFLAAAYPPFLVTAYPVFLAECLYTVFLVTYILSCVPSHCQPCVHRQGLTLCPKSRPTLCSFYCGQYYTFVHIVHHSN